MVELLAASIPHPVPSRVWPLRLLCFLPFVLILEVPCRGRCRSSSLARELLLCEPSITVLKRTDQFDPPVGLNCAIACSAGAKPALAFLEPLHGDRLIQGNSSPLCVTKSDVIHGDFVADLAPFQYHSAALEKSFGTPYPA